MRSIRKNRLIMFSIIFIIVISLTIGFSAFQKQLLIDDSIFNVRLQKDTRVSGIVLSGNGGSAESSYEEYNVSKIYGSVDFPSSSSYVLYKVSLTNYGNVKTGLLNITSNTSGVSYEICNSSGGSCTSNPKTAVCSGSNCTLGASKDIYVKVKSSSAGTKTIDLDFDFEPYNDITYSNIRENTSTFTQEIMTHDSLSLTLTSKPEEVEVSGTASYTYNKNTGVLNISNVGSDLSISAKYLSSDVAEDHYTGSNPDNYVMLGDELYRIVTKENVNDGFGNTDLRVKLIKETSIGNNQFDGLSNEFNGSSISTVLNETYYESMETETKNLIETVAWTENATSYIGLINSTDYTSNSSWMPQEGYTLTKAEDNKIVAITTTGLTDSNTTTSRATYPVVYLKESVLITSGEGTKTNPFILELAGNGLRTNPTVITGNTLTVNGSNQSLVTVTNQVGSPRYSLDNPLNASNYTSGDTTIPTGSVAKDYIVYFYIPEHNDGTNGYKAKAGSVSARINPLSFIVNYTKGANVASIGKNGDSCTTSGASTSCNVTLPSITPNPGNENGKWNYSGNQYNPGSSFTLNSSKNNITVTATASGSTYTATFNKNGATSIGSTSLTCTVTEGSTCTVTAPSIAREGYSTHGWGDSASAHSGVTGAITLSGDKTFYAVTSKDVTITFNKNGNTGQIKNGGTQSNETTITDSCTIWNTATSCNITSPEIVMDGYEKLGYSTGATTYSNYWNQKTAKAVSADATWYAQTAIAEKTVTITFNRNGNTSQTPKNGSASTATTVTESCTIAAARNGASQATTCSITSPTINMSGFTIIGYSDDSDNHTSSWNQNTAKDVSTNATYYAQSSKASIDRTITFYKNGNTAFTYNSTRYTDTSKTFTACTIPAVYNGATQNTSCTATITMPTIEVPTGFTPIGWSGASGTHTATYTSGQSNVSITMNSNKSFYAQSGKDAINRTVTFYRNGNTAFTYNSTRYTDTSKTFTACTIPAAYNGDTQGTSCTATINMPTIEAPENFTNIGWSDAADNHEADYTSGQTNVTLTMSANKSFYAQSSRAGINRTVTFYKNGNTAFTYNSTRYTDTSKTFTVCTTPTVYNGASQSTTCNATITMPTIEAPTGFTALGWSGAAGTHTAANSPGESVTLTMNANKSFYAQSKKNSVDRTITFYRNGNTSFTYNGTTYTDTSKTFTICTIPEAYNGDTQSNSCTATITMPTISVPTGFTRIGWSGAADTHTATYTSGQSNVSLTMTANMSLYAQSSKAAVNRTITFYKNGNTSFTYNGTTYTDTSKTFTICTIPAVYNGATQNTSCTATITMPTLTAPSGFTPIGWSDAADNHEVTYTSGQTNVSLTMSANMSLYAQSSKAAINRTITFYKNGNTSFTYNGTTYTDTSKTFTICTIPAVYNGATQGTSCTATITMPTITAPTGFTPIGWSGASGTHTATYTSGQTNVSLTMTANMPLYAQSNKAAVDRTITFYRNGNTNFKYNGTTYTDDSKTFTVCTIPAVYNGDTQSSSCSATITMPTITAPTGYNQNGWGTASDSTSPTYTAGQSATISMNSNKSYYALKTLIAVNTPTISGAGTYIYSQPVTLTCSTTSTYSTGTTLYYSFGYASSDGGTPSNWSTANTSSTYTFTISSTTARYYSCKVYATDGTQTTETVTSSADADAEVIAVNARVDFDATTNGGTLSGTTPRYVRYNNATIYANRSGANTGTVPTATKTGWTFDGWYTQATGGSKVINSSGTVQPNISGWTNSNGRFILTNPSNTENTNRLYAQFTGDSVTATFYYNSNTTSGQLTTETATSPCTVISGNSCTVEVPAVVQNSVGKYNSTYKGVTTALNSMGTTSLAISSNTTFYANYSSPITIYYPNSSNTVSNSNTALYRNEYFTDSSGTEMNTITSNANNNITQATSVTLTSLRGTFQGLETSANTYSNKYAINDENNLLKTNRTTYYAVVSASENAIIRYNSNTTSGSFTNSIAYAPTTSTYYCQSTTATGTSHGTTTTVPTTVQNSVGKYNSAYKGISSSSTGITDVTTFTGGSTYYAYYSSPITIYYPNTSNQITSSNTALYRNEYYSSTTAMTTRTCTSQTSTTQATTVTLSSIKGAFQGLETAVNTYSNKYSVNNSSNVVNTNIATFYAVVSANENISFYYNSNATSGSLTASTSQVNISSTFYCQSTSAMGTSHGTTTTVPTLVRNSVGKYNSAYKGISDTLNTINDITTFTGGNKYYAYYSSPVTVYYPKTTTTRDSYNYYRNEYFTTTSAMGAVINDEQNVVSNVSFTSSVTGYSLAGYNDTYSINTIQYSALSQFAYTDKSECYAILRKSVSGTFYYNNSGNTCGTTTITSTNASAYKYLRCTSSAAEISNNTINIPTAVSNSKGPYNGTYLGVGSLNSMTAITPSTATEGSSYYAIYRTDVTNYYYGSSYTNRSLYRNEFFTSASAMNAVLATTDASDQTANYTTSGGPNGSTWYGLADTNTTTRKYSTVALAAKSNTCTTNLYTIYNYNINYSKGSNVSGIGATTGSCQLKHGDTSCNVTLPTITPNTNYMSAGWNTTSGATTGTAAGGFYTVTTNTNVPTLYANAVLANYINTTTNESYSTLYDAFNAVANNQTIKVLQNTTETYLVTLASGKTGVKLDLNGKTITSSNSLVLLNDGTLDIYNTSSTTGTISSDFAISNNGTLTLNGTSTANKIIIESTDADEGNRAIHNESEKNLTINNNVEVRSINGSNNAIDNMGIIVITGGTVSGTDYGINNSSSGQLNISGSSTQIIGTSSFGIYNSGTTTINNGTVTGSTRGINNVGILTINGGTITGTYGLYNTNSGTATINGGSITGSTYGIYNISTATATILGGTITSPNRGIYLYAGTLTLGTKDSTVSTSSPEINTTGTYSKYGVYIRSGSTFNFYDGIVKSSSGTNYAISGTVSDTPDGYSVYKETTNGVESAYLVGSYLNTSTGVSYTTLNEAFSAVANNQTIKVMQNTTETTIASLASSKTGVKLDLNGKTITMSNKYINNNGTLDIYNTSSTTGTINGGSSYVLDNNGTLTLNGTSSTNSIKIVSTNSSSNIRVIGNSGLLTMNDNVEIIANNGTVNGINTSGTSTTNINGGSISVTGVGISNGGTLNVSGSTQITSTSSSGITNDGTATISGGTITASKSGIENNELGDTTGQLNVSGSNTTITGTNSGISNKGAATISGGTISGAFGIHNGEITINSTTYGGSLTVTGGTIIGTNYGIYTLTAATLTLGTKDSTVDTSSPSIQNTSSSNKYGVYVTSGGTFNFYDGIIKSSSGTGYAINGTVADTPTGYTVYKETVSGVESAYLTQPNYTNTTTGTGYNTLSEALNGVASNQTIKVMTNTTETTAATLASTKTGVTLDLNGKTITSSASPVITNSGTLTITNATTGNGVLQGSGTNTLTNSGTLYIKGDSISETTAIYNTKAAGSGNVLMNNSGKTAYLQSNATLKTTEYQDDDYRYVVKNYGILNIDGASIMGNKDSFDNGVQNYSTLNMSFGLIDAETEEGVGIEGVDSNAYTQNVTITGGLIKGNEYAIAYDGNNNSNSTVTIGVNDGTTSITTPELRANNYYAIAVGSNKTFNFYDGIIKSSHGTGYAINRTPDNIPTGYIVYKETVSGVESAYLITDYNYMNSSTNTGYTTLSAAFSAVESNQTIRVLNNVNETTAATLASGKTGVKLELNGKTITTTQTITNNGSLQISMSGTITTSSAIDLIVNNGTLTKNGSSTISNTQTSGNYTAIKNYGTATISNGTVHSEKYVGAMNYGTLNINGGTITSNASNSVWSNNTLNISGGNISVGNNTDAFTIGIAAGNATISGGTITGGLRGVLTTVNGSNSTVNISGSANLVNTSTILSAIDNYTTLNISGGTITSQNFDGIQNKVAASVITMTGGTITAGKAGIYLPAGTLTLGTNDSTVSTSSPLVESVADADSHGITNTGGTFNFYDGIVKSSSGMGYSIYGNVDNTPTGFIVTKTISSGVESAYLVDSSNTANTLMGSSIGAAASNYLRTTIARQDIETLTFTNSISGHTANGTNCWDVSVDEDGTVLAWVTDTDSDGKYEMTIGSSGGIVYASNCGFQFYYLNNLTAINGMEYFDTSRATSMTMMFGVCSSLESIDLSHLDTSNVTNMTGMFAGCSSLETLNISDFDTSHVTVMNQMFNGCSSLTTIYASGGFILPTPLQTTTQNMFNGCTSLIGGNGTEYDSNYVNGYYAVIDSPSEPGYFTDVSAMPTTTYTATFVYNSNTTAGSFTKATTTATCSTSGTSCTVSVPSTVSSSVGKYNSPYKGVYAGTGNMGSSSLTISADTTYYANYSGQVTENYYNGSSYQNRTLYRNEYFSSASAMAARLATSNTATTNMTHEVGPNNATFGGYSRTNGSTTTSYSSVSSAATTSVTTLYSVYKSQVTFNSSGHSGVSKNSSNSNTISCSFTNPNISCSITAPNYYPFSNYQENGWIINGTNENVAIGSTYTVSGIKTAVSNEIAISNPTTYTFRFVTPDISSPYPHGYRSRAVLSWWDYDSGDTYTQDNLATTKDMIADITLKSAVFNSPKEILVNIVSAINNHNINYISVTPKFTKDGTSNPTGGGDEIRAIYPPGVTWSYNGWKYNDTLLIDDDGLLIPNVSGYTDSKGHLLSTATFTETNGYVVLTPDYVYTVSSSGGGGLISSIGDDIVNSVGSISKSVGVSVKPMMKNDDVSEISSTSKFLGTDLLRGEIRSIKFDKTLGKHKVDDKNTWDVSNTQDGSILLWVDKVTDGYYDITIGQEGGVIAPSNAKYLFAYLNNLESIDLSNFDTSNTLDTTDMYYGCSSLNKQNIKEGV